MVEGPARARLRGSLVRWYRANGRHSLPWRLTRDPYAVLVSEVMLQQTQVVRVIPHYEHWLRRWPDVGSLARADIGDVLREWAGLGYNRRAVNLHRAALSVPRALPSTVAALGRLPGVGPYTARAVASFAFGQPVPVVDTNVARVLARSAHGIASARDVASSALQATAQVLLPRGGEPARRHNLALMDLGAMVCRTAAPACHACPWQRSCAWERAGRPPPLPRAGRTPRFETTARFARGRIVDALRRASALTVAELRDVLPPAHAPRIGIYLTALEADGLAQRADDGWRLGSAHGSNSIASPKL